MFSCCITSLLWRWRSAVPSSTVRSPWEPFVCSPALHVFASPSSLCFLEKQPRTVKQGLLLTWHEGPFTGTPAVWKRRNQCTLGCCTEPWREDKVPMTEHFCRLKIFVVVYTPPCLTTVRFVMCFNLLAQFDVWKPIQKADRAFERLDAKNRFFQTCLLTFCWPFAVVYQLHHTSNLKLKIDKRDTFYVPMCLMLQKNPSGTWFRIDQCLF